MKATGVYGQISARYARLGLRLVRKAQDTNGRRHPFGSHGVTKLRHSFYSSLAAAERHVTELEWLYSTVYADLDPLLTYDNPEAAS